MFSAFAQQDVEMSRQGLTKLGFENVRILRNCDTVYASVEDPSFRGTFRGGAKALELLAASFPDVSYYELLLEEYGCSKVCVHASEEDGKWRVSVNYDVEKTKRLLKQMEGVKSPYGKIDISLIPIISLANNKYDRLFDVGIFFAPSFSTSLWKGNRIIVQPIIPLYTNYDKTVSEADKTTLSVSYYSNPRRQVRLGVAAISQELMENDKWSAKVAAGSFYQNVVGLYGELGYHFNENLDLGVHAGYSYTSLFYDQKWYIGSPTMCNIMAKATYYEPVSSVQIELQGGRFMYGDWGGRLDLTRHFGEYAIGVYGILTGGEHNGGFHFAIPFGGKRQKRDGVFRIKAPEYYDMQYSMVSYYRYVWEKMAREFEEIPDKNRSAHYWQAKDIERDIQKMLNGTFE